MVGFNEWLERYEQKYQKMRDVRDRDLAHIYRSFRMQPGNEERCLIT